MLDSARPRLPELVVKPRVGHGGWGVVVCAQASPGELARLERALDDDPEHFVAQDLVELSRHPTASGGTLQPRHVDLRAFAVCRDGDCSVLPGGLTRYARAPGVDGRELLPGRRRQGHLGAHVRPLIGVTTSEMRSAGQFSPTPEGEPEATEMALGLSYLKAIEAAGGLPVVIPPMPVEAIDSLLERFAGVCLSGGPDLHPSGYGEQEDPHLGPTWPELDGFELALAARADARTMPVLTVCRGAQLLNVARGGTLIQHLPDRTGSARHRQTQPGEQVTHRVRLDPSGMLASIVAVEELEVNSFHHQAVDRLGEGVVATAFAPDGVVEAIEMPESPGFVLAVQWELQESWQDAGAGLAVFDLLVTAARERARARAAQVSSRLSRKSSRASRTSSPSEAPTTP
jgi:putative glutamine amidotransferase